MNSYRGLATNKNRVWVSIYYLIVNPSNPQTGMPLILGCRKLCKPLVEIYLKNVCAPLLTSYKTLTRSAVERQQGMHTPTLSLYIYT